MKVLTYALALSVGLALPVHSAMAHSGGVDRNGCHYEDDRNFHCHEESDPTEEKLLRLGLIFAGGWLLQGAIGMFEDDDDTQAQTSFRFVPHVNGKDGTGLTAEYDLGRSQVLGFGATSPGDRSQEGTRISVRWTMEF